MQNDRLAKLAYTAYANEINHPLDEWDDLKIEEKEGWRAAADAIVLSFGTKPLEPVEDGPLAD